MKHLYFFLLYALLLIGQAGETYAQNCANGAPLFYVNLAGQPNGAWQSPPIQRGGDCCSASDVNCIEFIVTLDSMATGILFNIVSGALPPGALYYQVNCGPLTAVGTPVCLNGPGPHDITFCKPGNNLNVYEIASIPIPDVTGTEWVSEACTGSMSILGLDSTTTTWTSIPPNALYNSYLSCTSGCNNVSINPTGILPPYIDYQVCGYPIGGCYITPFCDTMRVNFVNTLAVAITPQNPVICFGGPLATVTANVTGGNDPYNYTWSNGAITPTVTVGPGTYYVSITDSMNCSIATDSVVVTAMSATITANAGPDQVLCLNNVAAQLNGSVIAATGGMWTGGGGAFMPGPTTLNAVYIPSPAEINNGSTQLMLVTTGNNTCPADTDYVVISITPNPAPAIQGPSPVCEYSATTYSTPYNSGNVYSWNVTGGTIVATATNAITVLWGPAGNGTVSVTETNSLLCDSTVSTSIVIAPQPVPVISGPLITCTTTSTSFSITSPVPGNTYSWNVTGGTITGPANGSSVLVSWTAPGTATITVTETNNLGCDSTVAVQATVLTMPAPVLAGPDTVCEMQTVVYATPYITGNSYSWNVSGGTVIANNNNSIIVQWPASGSGAVSVTETNTATCDSTVSVNIIVAPQPAPVINGVLTTCTTTGNLYSVLTPVPGNNYSWTVSGGTILGNSTGPAISVFWNTPGTALITVTESNSLGCDSTVTVTATVLTMPAPVLAGPDTVCALHTIVYSTPLVSGHTYSWNVTGGTIVSNNINSIAVQWPANGTGSVTVTESNTAACVSTATQNIFIAPQPVPVISGSLTSCTSTYSQFSVNNAIPGNNYTWAITGGIIVGPSNGTTVNVFWNNAGTATLSFTEINYYGCDSTVSVNINALQRPEPDITGPPVVCEEQQETYTVNAYIPSHTYYWSVTNGSIIGLNVGSSIEVLWNNPGTGTVTLRQVSPNGCDSTTFETVVINPLPLPVIAGPASFCENEAATYSTTLVQGNTYIWSTTGGIISGPSTGSQITVNWTSGSMANVFLTETTPLGCLRNVQLPVQIMNKPEPGIQGNTIGCVSSVAYNYFTTPEPGINYQWSVTGGTITSGNGSASVAVQWQSTGSQTITLVATNTLTGCDSAVTFNVLTGSLPTPVIQAPALSGCMPFTANFSGNVLNPAYTYSWDFGDGTTGSGPNPSHEYNQPGTYDVQLIATNNTGCVDTVTTQVMAYPVPEAVFNLWHGTGTYYANISNMTLENLSTGGTSYFWTFGNGANSNEFEPIYQYTEPGIYTIALVVTNQYGCQDMTSTQLVVKLPENIYVPNAFTPNGDNKNDYFSVASYNIEDFRINIFNRWGHLIYTSADPMFQWDGKYNGTEVSNGVYVYSVKATGMFGSDFNFIGTVTVVK